MVELELDSRVCRLNAIKKAAYKFGGRCHVDIRLTDTALVRVTLRSKRPLAESSEFIAGEFRNEVLDQELREVVAEETSAIRDVLIAQAFSRTSLLDPVGETADYHADPLTIGFSDV